MLESFPLAYLITCTSSTIDVSFDLQGQRSRSQGSPLTMKKDTKKYKKSGLYIGTLIFGIILSGAFHLSARLVYQLGRNETRNILSIDQPRTAARFKNTCLKRCQSHPRLT